MAEDVLAEEFVRATLGLQSGHKVVLAEIGNSIYKREGDGYWYRLQGGDDGRHTSAPGHSQPG